MNARTLALFASIAFVAVMIGLFGARACASSKRPAVAVAPPPVAQPPPQIDPHAPLVAPIASEPVDAGEAMPLVAIAANDNATKAPRARIKNASAPAREEDEEEAPPPPPPPPPVKPVIVDAGTPAPIVDAGAAVAARVERSPDALPSAPLKVVYRDELGWLKLVELRVFLNGKRVVEENPTDANRPPRGERTLFETQLFPGHHQVRIETTYVGESSGIFDYMNNVRVRMREMTVVEVDEKRGARVLAHAFDRGALEPWEKRPGLKLTTTEK